MTHSGPVIVSRSSLPLPLAGRNWSTLVLTSVCMSTGVASWAFVIGGAAATFLNFKMGIFAMIAGALIGQLLVTLATVPVSTKFGIETTISTKSQLGVRGSYAGLFMMLTNAVGWNTVLMIFLGRSVARVLIILGVIGESAAAGASIIISVTGLLIIGFFVTRGSGALKKSGPAVASVIVILAAWLIYLLFREYGSAEILAAAPLAPTESKLLNYTLVTEMLIGGTFGWWGYMGGIVRMVPSAGRTVMPTMIGLGAAWAVVASVSLIGGLMTGEGDPTVWVPEIAGPVGAVVFLLFISVANLGSVLVGVYVTTLALKQAQVLGPKVHWKWSVMVVITPMVLILVFFPNAMYDGVPIFMAFLGLITGPMIGVQIADWFVLRRGTRLPVSSLYKRDSSSAFWYFGGFNPAGLLALVLGSGTYLLIMNPLTLVPHSQLFTYTTASVPSVLVGGVSYVLLTLLMRKLFPGVMSRDLELQRIADTSNGGAERQGVDAEADSAAGERALSAKTQR